MPDDVNPTPPSSSGEAAKVDDRGVSWENRAREYERKYNAVVQDLEEIKSELHKEDKPVESETEKQARVKEKILKFVEDPDSYIESKAKELLTQRELPKQIEEAKSWLNSKGYQPSDEAELVRIMHENGLEGAPLAKAKAAWSIYKLEKMQATSETPKPTFKSSPEGSGRSVPPSSGKSRTELLKSLKDTQKQHGLMSKEAADIMMELSRLA